MLDVKQKLDEKSMFGEKKELRERFLKKRDSLENDEVVTMSAKVFNNLMHSSEFISANTILFYYAHKNEVDLLRGMRFALAHNQRVLLPRIDDRDEKIKLYLHEVRNLEYELERGRYGIMQPREECAEVSVDEVDVFLIPGIVFDVSGRRLGYGYGYYDRLLARVARGKQCVIGVAYQWQVLEKIHGEEHDVQVDFILTEKGLMKCGV